VCYLCGLGIAEDQDWNRDHVPPQRFYGKSIRAAFNPNLHWLPTHTTCNSAYKKDEEYYVASFAGHADSESAASVFEDFRRAVGRGHDTGLFKMILGQFGKVALADGSVVFNYDAARAGRISWKLARGIYFTETGRVLAEDVPKRITMLSPGTHPEKDHPWWPIVRDTASMGVSAPHGGWPYQRWLRGSALQRAVRAARSGGFAVGGRFRERGTSIRVCHRPLRPQVFPPVSRSGNEHLRTPA